MRAPAVDAQLFEVEQHAVVQVPLVDVGADLPFVVAELLRRRFGVEHEAVGDEVHRCEVWLEPAAAELREVRIGSEAEDPLEESGKQRFGQELLVLARPCAVEVVAQRTSAVELLEQSATLVDDPLEPADLVRNRSGAHQNPARSAPDRARTTLPSEPRASFRTVQTSIASDTGLTTDELAALRRAGAWYAKYHAVRIADLAEDPSAYAERKREDFLTLVDALRKLGFEMAVPDALRDEQRRAA